MTINKNLSVKGCWRMVNAIQNGKTPIEIRQRCNTAEKWLVENDVISFEEYNDMMMAISYLYRESFHM